MADPRWSDLPTDICTLIVSRLALRPRFLVASLVCRRWRDAVRRSLCKLPIRAPQAIADLPSVTKITTGHVSWYIISCPKLPSTLRSLTYVRYTSPSSCHCDNFSGVTSLTSLHLSTGCCDAIFHIMRCNPHLTDLRFDDNDISDSGKPPTKQSFSSIRLPQLRSLELRVSNGASTALDFVRAHASQLTHCYFEEDWLVYPLRFPVCVSGSGSHSSFPSAEMLRRVLEIAPNLKRWYCNANLRLLSDAQGMPLHLLKNLSVECAKMDGGKLYQFLFDCSALTELTLFQPPAVPAAQLPSFLATMSRLLSFRQTSIIDPAPILVATQLRKLSIPAPFLGPLVRGGWPFLRLIELMVATPFLPFTTLYDDIYTVLNKSPLHKLDLQFAMSADEMPQVTALLQLAESRGVEHVWLNPRSDATNAIPAKCWRWLDLKVTPALF